MAGYKYTDQLTKGQVTVYKYTDQLTKGQVTGYKYTDQFTKGQMIGGEQQGTGGYKYGNHCDQVRGRDKSTWGQNTGTWQCNARNGQQDGH